VCVVGAALAARAWLWSSPDRSGLRRADAYPSPTVPVPAGTRVLVLSPWRDGPRAGTSDLRVRILFPPDGGAPRGSAYDGVLSAVTGDSGRVVLLTGGHSSAERRGALTRTGQRCLYVPGLIAPSDSLVVLLTGAMVQVPVR